MASCRVNPGASSLMQPSTVYPLVIIAAGGVPSESFSINAFSTRAGEVRLSHLLRPAKDYSFHDRTVSPALQFGRLVRLSHLTESVCRV
jgi:hypothetical protein